MKRLIATAILFAIPAGAIAQQATPAQEQLERTIGNLVVNNISCTNQATALNAELAKANADLAKVRAELAEAKKPKDANENSVQGK